MGRDGRPTTSKVSTTAQHTHLLTPLNFSVLQGSLGNFPVIGPIPAENINISNVRGSQTQLQVSVAQPLTQLQKLGLGLELEIKNSQETRRDAPPTR